MEMRRAFSAQAYMLIFIREDEKEDILKEPAVQDIPHSIKDMFNEENEVLEKMKKEIYVF